MAAALEGAGAAGRNSGATAESWIVAFGGNVSLDLEILRRTDRQPQAGAAVEAVIEGALTDGHHTARATIRDACEFSFRCRRWGRAIWRL